LQKLKDLVLERMTTGMGLGKEMESIMAEDITEIIDIHHQEEEDVIIKIMNPGITEDIHMMMIILIIISILVTVDIALKYMKLVTPGRVR